VLINSQSTSSLVDLCWKGILDTLFPLRCLGCQKRGFWLCPQCEKRIPLRIEQRCPRCFSQITPSGEICFACQKHTSETLDGLFVASYYKDPLLSHALHTYKYRFLPGLSQSLGHLLQSALEKSPLVLPDALVPVPLHPRRLRFRGFNQSLLLAQEIAGTLAPGITLPVFSDVLIRSRYTKPQMKTTSREERLHNLKDAFALLPEKAQDITGKHLWLIDDVATTGTTLEECARVLKKHGAKSVFGIVLAR
jgi:ComF family protein